MALSVSSPVVRLSSGSPAEVDTDLLIVPAFDGEAVADTLPAVDQATGGEVARATASGEMKGRLYEAFVTPASGPGWKPRRVAVVGAGKAADFTSERLRKVATAAALMARGRRIPRVAFLARGPIPARAAVQAITEGLDARRLQCRSGTRQVSASGRPRPPSRSSRPGRSSRTRRRWKQAVQRGQILGDSSNLARAFANEPSNVLTPRLFAERATAIATEAGLGVEILDETQIEKLGMGLLLGVARGSAEPPRVIVLRHDPPGAPGAPVLGLVGKGITFDTGGISIKPAEGMERMKDDMAGGAAVICAMRAIALLKAPIRVVGIVPTTENMPGGKAMKPGDVLTGASGKTVEVINTDAEGRLILGDGLWYARRTGRHAPRRRRDAHRRLRGRPRQGGLRPLRPAGRVA